MLSLTTGFEHSATLLIDNLLSAHSTLCESDHTLFQNIVAETHAGILPVYLLCALRSALCIGHSLPLAVISLAW